MEGGLTLRTLPQGECLSKSLHGVTCDKPPAMAGKGGLEETERSHTSKPPSTGSRTVEEQA